MASVREQLDLDLGVLQSKKQEWAELPLDKKIALLKVENRSYWKDVEEFQFFLQSATWQALIAF